MPRQSLVDEPEKIQLVLLSGLLCDASVWTDVALSLSDIATVNCLAFSGFESIGSMADYVLDSAPPKFALAGHSMGGRVALEVVARSPHRIRGLALLNTGAHPRGNGEVESRGRLVALAQTQGMAALAAEWLPPMIAPAARTLDLISPLAAMIERSSPDSFAGQIRALLNRPDHVPLLPTIEVPTLLVSGTADTWSPLRQHEEMQRLIPGSSLVTIEGAGHMSLTEKPAAVAAALRDWLAGL